jgi:c-di-GMP-binding flagellar brake protein YcgR
LKQRFLERNEREHMMQDKRRHKRFKLDLMEINGKMLLAQKVEIIDISCGGVALRTDRRLSAGREYVIKLGYKKKSIDVKGIVVRCELSNIEERSDGESVSIYSAGVMFKDMPSNMVADFINSIEHDKKEAVPVTVDRRLNVRFYITAPLENTLSFPAQFTVTEISLCGMLIRTEQALEVESRIPMGLSLQGDRAINFIGRVASCRMTEDPEKAHYDIGVEFLDLTDEDKMLLTAFIDYLAGDAR